MQAANRTRRVNRLDELRRNDYVSESETRQQHLAESPHVNRSSFLIESLNCGERSPLVTELAVIIVLDDPGVCARGKVDELAAT